MWVGGFFLVLCEAMGKRIQGILFDLGDTLLDFGGINVRKIFGEGGKLAYEYLESLGQRLPSFKRYHHRQLWAIRWHYFINHLTGREFNSLDLMGQICRRFDLQLRPDQLEELAWLWYEPLSLMATVEEGLPEMLAEMRQSGLTLGIVSNTFVPAPVLDRHLRQEGMLEPLSVRVYSCDVGFRKPRKEIFNEALSRAQLDPKATIFVGDSPRADIVGANRMGMISVLKDPTDRHIARRIPAGHRIRSILQLREIVARYGDAE